MNDLAEQIALGCYGKSGRANAPENSNANFRAGYETGKSITNTIDAITQEWVRRGQPDFSLPFQEWKRGIWAAVMQRTVATTVSGQKEQI